MTTRRDLLLGFVAGAAGFGLLADRALAWSVEELTPDQAATLAAACRAKADDHAGLISAARQDLIQRIAQGLLPAGADENVACPVCGCHFVVTAGGTN